MAKSKTSYIARLNYIKRKKRTMSANTEQKELDKQTAKFIATLACNLPSLTGDEMQDWIGNPRKLKKFLAGLKPATEQAEAPEKVIDLNVWKTIVLGSGLENADDFRTALKKAGCRIGDWGNDILGKPAFTVSKEEVEVDLVIKSVAELGFPNGATRAKIYEKAIELGLELCPSEVGPQLRLQYLDQPNNEWLLIAMEPISGSGGVLLVFDVGRVGGDRWLFAHCGLPGRLWRAACRWVFVQPRK